MQAKVGQANAMASALPAAQVRRVSMSGATVDGHAYGLAYPWLPSDAGRSASRRACQRNDCAVRALAMVHELPYDQAYDLLAAAGRKCGKGFRFKVWMKDQAWAIHRSFPAVRGERRMNPATFVSRFPRGRFICQAARHVFAVVDGVVIDEFENRADRCIYGAWEISAPMT